MSKSTDSKGIKPTIPLEEELVYQTDVERGKPSEVSTEIAIGIMEKEDTPAEEIIPRIGEVVDPDSLDRIFSTPKDANGWVTFFYENFRIILDSNRTIRIYKMDISD